MVVALGKKWLTKTTAKNTAGKYSTNNNWAIFNSMKMHMQAQK